MKLWQNNRISALILAGVLSLGGLVGQVAFAESATNVNDSKSFSAEVNVKWATKDQLGNPVPGLQFVITGGGLPNPLEVNDNSTFDLDKTDGVVVLDASKLAKPFQVDGGTRLPYELKIKRLPDGFSLKSGSEAIKSFTLDELKANDQFDFTLVKIPENMERTDVSSEAKKFKRSAWKRASDGESRDIDSPRLRWSIKDEYGNQVPGVAVIIEGPYSEVYGRYSSWTRLEDPMRVVDQDANDQNKSAGSVELGSVWLNKHPENSRYRIRIDTATLPDGYFVSESDASWRTIDPKDKRHRTVGNWNGGLENLHDFGTFTVKSKFGNGPFDSGICAPNTALSIDVQGNLFTVANSNDSHLNRKAGSFSSLTKQGEGSWNSVAVDTKLRYVYATYRISSRNKYDKSFKIARIKLNDDGSLSKRPEWVTNKAHQIRAIDYRPRKSGTRYGGIIAGAADPVTGDYYLGASYWNENRRGNDANMYLSVVRYNVARNSVENVGTIKTHLEHSNRRYQGVWNGDFAFNAQGDLTVVGGTGRSVDVVSVRKNDLVEHAGFDRSIPHSISESFTLNTDKLEKENGINGVSFDYNGSVFFGNAEKLFLANPANLGGSTFLINGKLLPGNSKSTDLASCALPTTVTLLKDVKDRAPGFQNDQFELVIRNKDTGQKLSSATTSGRNRGVQKEFAGPIPIQFPSTLILEEKLTDSKADLKSRYSSTYVCRNHFDHVVASGVGTSFELPVQEKGAAITCTFENAPIKTSLTLTKMVLPNTQSLAKPTDWELVATNTSTGTAVSFNSGDKKEVTPGTYRFSEKFISRKGLSQEQGKEFKLDEFKCFDADSGKVLFSLEHPITNADNMILDIGVAQNVECTFVNLHKPPNGSLKWRKVDSEQHSLANSEWSLKGPKGSVKVSDCVTEKCDPATHDLDPRPGYFKVDGLTIGDYLLEETRAPTGFVINQNDRSRSISLSTSVLNVDISDRPFVNNKTKVPPIPLTGGSSTDAFLITGAGLLFLSLLVVGIRRKFNKA
ncbi:MSCRAMM family protein [Arcanobacterium phocae]|uniref:MSCRAMM family protein n=1 Tax=Arcanobacterium phocae TaxID=131112 RepID=UPI001C0F08EA|nr:prealbumin-like fold domain-containing protein [Arcanobacterium phocae]